MVMDTKFIYPASLWLPLDQAISAKLTKGGNRQALGRGYSLFPLTLADTPTVGSHSPLGAHMRDDCGDSSVACTTPQRSLNQDLQRTRSGEPCLGNSYPEAMRWSACSRSTHPAWPYGKSVSDEGVSPLGSICGPEEHWALRASEYEGARKCELLDKLRAWSPYKREQGREARGGGGGVGGTVVAI